MNNTWIKITPETFPTIPDDCEIDIEIDNDVYEYDDLYETTMRTSRQPYLIMCPVKHAPTKINNYVPKGSDVSFHIGHAQELIEKNLKTDNIIKQQYFILFDQGGNQIMLTDPNTKYCYYTPIELPDELRHIGFPLISSIMRDCLEIRGYHVTKEKLSDLIDIYEDCQDWSTDGTEMLTGTSYNEIEDFVKHSRHVEELFNK